MTDKHRLSTRDVVGVFRLLGEVVELGRNPDAWRLHAIQGLSAMVDARVALANEHFISPADANYSYPSGIVEWGWAPGEQERFHEYLRTDGASTDPMHVPAKRLIFRSFTRTRSDLVSDDIWYAHPSVAEARRACNVDDSIYSRWRLPQPGWGHAISLHRPWKGTRFSARDRLLVSLFHRELGGLWRRMSEPTFRRLPRRLWQSLDLIYSGYSEKQIALTLGVSQHSAHDFIKRLYTHFNVRSRVELMLAPGCRRLMLCPALSPLYYEHCFAGKDPDWRHLRLPSPPPAPDKAD